MTVACPHCGRQFVSVGGNYNIHVSMCPEQPEIAEAIRVALTDPDRPGRAVTVHEYNRRKRGTVASRSGMLIQMYGGWRKVCERFGLQRTKTNGLDAPLTEWERHACALRGMAERAYTER